METNEALGRRNQQYVSEELTHFVGRAEPNDDARYKLLLEILRSGSLKSSASAPDSRLPQRIEPDLSKPLSSNECYVPHCVCFCDIPRNCLRLHMGKYSRFGVAFTKEWLDSRGASPVLYVARDTPVTDQGMVLKEARRLRDNGRIRQDVYEEIEANSCQVGLHTTVQTAADAMDQMFPRSFLGLTEQLGRPDSYLPQDQRTGIIELRRVLFYHLFAYLKFFDHALPDDHPDNYYMEREWRVLRSVDFTLQDVALIIRPRAYAVRFAADVPELRDKTWDAD